MLRGVGMYLLPAAAVSMLTLAAFHVAKQQKPLTSLEPVQAPARTAFDETVAATGIAEAQTENIVIGSALDGVIEEVYVPSTQVGTRVEAGTLLFRVDDRHLRAQLAVAEARRASAAAQLAKLEQLPRPEELPPAEARVRSAKAATDQARDDYRRAEQLYRRNVVTEQEFIAKRLAQEAAQHNLSQAESELALLRAGAWEPDKAIARAALEQSKAEADQIRTEIERALVRAPVDGEVLQVNVRLGEHVSARNGGALVVLGNVRTLHVRADIDENDIPRFRKDAPAAAYLRGDAEHSYRLRFERVEPMVVAKKSLSGDNAERIDTRVLQVIYSVVDADAPFYVGQQLDVFIQGAPHATTVRAVAPLR
jgi:HlyD family secretion protein